MEKKIETRPESGVALRIHTGKGTQDIKYSDISKYWDSGDEENIRSVSVITRGDLVMLLMLTADGLDGVIAGWDIKKGGLVHLSDGSYCVSMKLFGSELYTLCRVENFAVPRHYQVYAVPVGSFDQSNAGRRIYCKSPCSSAGMGRNIRLDISRGGIAVTDGKNSVTYADSPDRPAETPAEGFEYLYAIPLPKPGEDGAEKIEGMFT